MIDYHKDAVHEMALVSGSSENRLKQAEIYAYMARTEVLKASNPEPVIKYKSVTDVYVIEEKTGGSGWKTLDIYINEQAAAGRLRSLEHAASASNGYWEVRLKSFPVSTS